MHNLLVNLYSTEKYRNHVVNLICPLLFDRDPNLIVSKKSVSCSYMLVL